MFEPAVSRGELLFFVYHNMISLRCMRASLARTSKNVGDDALTVAGALVVLVFNVFEKKCGFSL